MMIEVLVPDVGESVTEVVVGEWLKTDGARVDRDDPLCVIESEKAAMEIVAGASGRLHIKAKTGEVVRAGQVLAEIDTAAEAEREKPPGSGGERKRVTPVARKMMEEAGVRAGEIEGSGPGGRITKSDVLTHLAERRETGSPTEPVGAEGAAKRNSEKTGEPDAPCEPRRNERRQPMSTLRKTVARHLVAAKNDTAMLTTFNEIDMSAISSLRREFKDTFAEKHGVKLGFMSLFARAACLALKEWPAVNARIDGDDIVFHDHVDLSVAVSTPRGLVAPVVRDAQQKSLARLESDIQALAEKARDGRLSIEEMAGGTFTLTNGGIFGSLLSTPILNAPQSAVLGMHAIQDRPVAREGKVEIRPMMYVALSYDHRIIDGREAVLFLLHVKTLLESTQRLLLEL